MISSVHWKRLDYIGKVCHKMPVKMTAKCCNMDHKMTMTSATKMPTKCPQNAHNVDLKMTMTVTATMPTTSTAKMPMTLTAKCLWHLQQKCLRHGPQNADNVDLKMPMTLAAAMPTTSTAKMTMKMTAKCLNIYSENANYIDFYFCWLLVICKGFWNNTSGPNVIKLFTAVIYDFRNKL